MKKTKNKGMRWAARISGTAMVAFVLLFGIGQLMEHSDHPGPGLSTFNVYIFIVWGVGLAGLLLALWKEGLGGTISLLSFIAFNILAAVNPTPGSGYTPVLLVFLIPSLLYLRCWWEEKNSVHKMPAS